MFGAGAAMVLLALTFFSPRPQISWRLCLDAHPARLSTTDSFLSYIVLPTRSAHPDAVPADVGSSNTRRMSMQWSTSPPSFLIVPGMQDVLVRASERAYSFQAPTIDLAPRPSSSSPNQRSVHSLSHSDSPLPHRTSRTPRLGPPLLAFDDAQYDLKHDGQDQEKVAGLDEGLDEGCGTGVHAEDGAEIGRLDDSSQPLPPHTPVALVAPAATFGVQWMLLAGKAAGRDVSMPNSQESAPRYVFLFSAFAFLSCFHSPSSLLPPHLHSPFLLLPLPRPARRRERVSAGDVIVGVGGSYFLSSRTYTLLHRCFRCPPHNDLTHLLIDLPGLFGVDVVVVLRDSCSLVRDGGFAHNLHSVTSSLPTYISNSVFLVTSLTSSLYPLPFLMLVDAFPVHGHGVSVAAVYQPEVFAASSAYRHPRRPPTWPGADDGEMGLESISDTAETRDAGVDDGGVSSARASIFSHTRVHANSTNSTSGTVDTEDEYVAHITPLPGSDIGSPPGIVTKGIRRAEMASSTLAGTWTSRTTRTTRLAAAAHAEHQDARDPRFTANPIAPRLHYPLSTSPLVHPSPIHVQFRHHPHHLVPLPPLLLPFVCLLPPISRLSASMLLSADYLHPDLPELPEVERCTAAAAFPSPPTLVTASVGVVVDDGDHPAYRPRLRQPCRVFDSRRGTTLCGGVNRSGAAHLPFRAGAQEAVVGLDPSMVIGFPPTWPGADYDDEMELESVSDPEEVEDAGRRRLERFARRFDLFEQHPPLAAHRGLDFLHPRTFKLSKLHLRCEQLSAQRGSRFDIGGAPPTAGSEVDIEDDWVDPVATSPPALAPSGKKSTSAAKARGKGRGKKTVSVPNVHYYPFPSAEGRELATNAHGAGRDGEWSQSDGQQRYPCLRTISQVTPLVVFTLHAGVYAAYPRPVEGEIPSSPPAARPPFVFGARTSPSSTRSVPPTQPRFYQTQLHRAPPSAPKALQEAQNPSSGGPSTCAAGAACGGRGGRFNGLVPQTMPAESLKPPVHERTNRRGGHLRKHRGRRGGHG
ncbi:hypothetical protein C8R44DRAFT_874311 [Mycena epipterygia]|nr:hypothetical protein C8R44DRAFT_874311 [Mycena epipterygia]